MKANTNRSVTKSKVVLIALLAIVFVCAVLVVCVAEIRQYNIYKQQIASQDRQIEELEKAKDYYESDNYDNNSSRDQGYAGENDLQFDEEKKGKLI